MGLSQWNPARRILIRIRQDRKAAAEPLRRRAGEWPGGCEYFGGLH